MTSRGRCPLAASSIARPRPPRRDERIERSLRLLVEGQAADERQHRGRACSCGACVRVFCLGLRGRALPPPGLPGDELPEPASHPGQVRTAPVAAHDAGDPLAHNGFMQRPALARDRRDDDDRVARMEGPAKLLPAAEERPSDQGAAIEIEEVEDEVGDRQTRTPEQPLAQGCGIGATGGVDHDELTVDHRRAGLEPHRQIRELRQQEGQVPPSAVDQPKALSIRHPGVRRFDEGERTFARPARLEEVVGGVERLGRRPGQHRPERGRKEREIRLEVEGELVGHGQTARPWPAGGWAIVRDGSRFGGVYPPAPMTTTHRDSLARERAQELIRAWDGRPGHLGSLLGRVTPVDQVGVEERVDSLKKRSIKRESKLWALDLAIRMMDLTTLEGKDTPGKVRALSAKAIRPKPGDASIPSVAAICVYPALVPEAKDALRGSTVKVASVATGFPSGQTFRDLKLAETRQAVEAGADEIDMVIDRGAFLAGDYLSVFEEIVDVKEACGDAHLKVILETGELETYDNVRRASVLAMAAGGDFIKTSTGKVQPAATLPVTLVMLEAIRDVHRQTGRAVGMKPAGGIRTAKEAVQYLVVLYETLGPRWMTPDLFRFGASTLLNDVLMQIEKERTGRYSDPDDFTID